MSGKREGGGGECNVENDLSMCKKQQHCVRVSVQGIVKGQTEDGGEGLLMATSSSSVDVASEARLTVRGAQRQCMLCVW